MAKLFSYAAFVSYSSADAKFAQRLHRALEGYGIPASLGQFDLTGGTKRNRIYPVFRDREELPAGELGERIEAALKASGALIVVCSPNGAASPWVQREIEFFIGLGRRERVFAIIADTAPSIDVNGADCTPSCFPPALRGDAIADAHAFQPLAADARKGKDGFRNAWLKLVAGMIGVTPGQIIDRDRRRRRQQAAQTAAVWVLALLGVGYAYTQRTTLEPLWISWTNYQPYVVSGRSLIAAPPGTTFQDCRSGSANCPTMVVVPEGSFLMGSAPDDPGAGDDEFPLREISISRFAVSQNELTIANWRACFDAGACGNEMPPQYDGGDEHPVVNVFYEDAQKYVRWLSRMTGQDYRLLSEAEWEFAARGVTTDDAAHHTRFSWGDEDPVCNRNALNGANFRCSDVRTLPVGSFLANAFGLHDMHSNVWEWVEDCYAPYDPAGRDGGAVRHDADGGGGASVSRGCIRHIMRGGSWVNGSPADLSSANREYDLLVPGLYGGNIGFRVARTLSDGTD